MLRTVHQSFSNLYAESLVIYHVTMINGTEAEIKQAYSNMCAYQEALNSEAKYQAQLSV
jgi:hypothetical protein